MRNASKVTKFRRAGGVYKLTMWIPKVDNGVNTKRWGSAATPRKTETREDDPMEVGVLECGMVPASEWEQFQEIRRSRSRRHGVGSAGPAYSLAGCKGGCCSGSGNNPELSSVRVFGGMGAET